MSNFGNHFNHQGFVIADPSGNPPVACAQFEYKGHMISMSQVFFPPQVVVFDQHWLLLREDFSSVEEAIKFVDEWERT